MQRPDFTHLDPETKAYIEYLENRLESTRKSPPRSPVELEPIDVREAPTTRQVISISRSGMIKRSDRHLYPRQRRGGMGIFEMEVSQKDMPAELVHIDESESLLLFTDRARTFRMPVARLESVPLRSKGQALPRQIALQNGERIVAAVPVQAEGYLTLLSESGYVRSLRHHLFGEYMKPGTEMFKNKDYGALAGVCWSVDDCDILVATRSGMGIRFNRKLIPPKGIQAIRMAQDDRALAVTSVDEDEGVFFLSKDGMGTVRSMAGFAANKSAGGSGKITMKADEVAAAFNVRGDEDIFVISELSKVIRFSIAEVPAKEGVVQGVHCISLRADSVVTAVRT